jgi:hypothetical protein
MNIRSPSELLLVVRYRTVRRVTLHCRLHSGYNPQRKLLLKCHHRGVVFIYNEVHYLAIAHNAIKITIYTISYHILIVLKSRDKCTQWADWHRHMMKLLVVVTMTVNTVSGWQRWLATKSNPTITCFKYISKFDMPALGDCGICLQQSPRCESHY